MTKWICSLLFLLISLTINAQTYCPSICGIKTGTEKNTAKKILIERFGISSVHEDGGNLELRRCSVGGLEYEFLIFYFAWVNGKFLFNDATFYTPFELSEQKEAIKFRELIMSAYSEKYKIFESKNENGFKEYLFGNGNDFYGVISLRRGKGRDGKTRLYVEVSYCGPYSSADDI